MTKEELQNMADTYGLYTEEDVENRISCRLLAVGARNEELEAENAELQDKLKNLASVAEVRLANWQKYEKEIEELKEKLESVEKARDYWKESSFDWRHKCMSRKSVKVAVKAQKQLEKAKDLIRNLLRVTYGAGWNYSLDWKVQAEQFLKEE